MTKAGLIEMAQDLIAEHTAVDACLEMYEAGQRAERVRIVFELDELLGDVGDGKLARFMDELRADPAESGE